MSCTWTSAEPLLGLFTFVDQTCTAPVDSPPLTLIVTFCAALAVVVSTIVV
jgi:hypothetical protein